VIDFEIPPEAKRARKLIRGFAGDLFCPISHTLLSFNRDQLK